MKNTTVCTVCLYLRPKGFEAHASGDGWLGEFGWERYICGLLLRKRGGVVVVVVVVFTLKAVPVSTQYFLTSVLVQLTRTPSVVTG